MDHAAAWLVAVLQVIEDEVEELADAGQGSMTKPITALDVFRVVRRLVDPPPNVNEVAAVLDFLASPLLGGLTKAEDGYLPGVDASAVAQRLLDLAEPLVEVHEQTAESNAYFKRYSADEDDDRY
ncbi:hypothetical protein [Nocardia iowensis]|uniref:Uncharacterized protein n=1 Tax=Nocardia iowensis TaxID=204891 RepID=A0ABX8RQM6_NOCIO|nr:hypothetical protein [Nocardia iowensis]QXN91945.1 hypothetical protein KV110_01770 [Nocardia iowensis]